MLRVLGLPDSGPWGYFDGISTDTNYGRTQEIKDENVSELQL